MSVLINMAESISALEDESFYNVTMFYVLEMIYVQMMAENVNQHQLELKMVLIIDLIGPI